MPYLILYSKPGCHLCEGLQEKLNQVIPAISPDLTLEVRDITTQADWWQAYEYEVPVLFWATSANTSPQLIPRPSPRCSVAQLQKQLEPYWQGST
jgi:glutaredoxin